MFLNVRVCTRAWSIIMWVCCHGMRVVVTGQLDGPVGKVPLPIEPSHWPLKIVFLKMNTVPSLEQILSGPPACELTCM